MEVNCTKAPTGALIPWDSDESAKLSSIKAGTEVRVNIVKMRNGPFFRKWWALAKYAFDIWADTREEQLYKGIPVRPNFERFRKDLIILTGHYDATYDVNGGVHLEAKSLSWSSMDEDEFERLYSETINVILSKILNNTRFTEADLRAHVDRVMQFDR